MSGFGSPALICWRNFQADMLPFFFFGMRFCWNQTKAASSFPLMEERVCCGSHDRQYFVVSERINSNNKVSKEYFQLKRVDLAVEKQNFYKKLDFWGKFLFSWKLKFPLKNKPGMLFPSVLFSTAFHLITHFLRHIPSY